MSNLCYYLKDHYSNNSHSKDNSESMIQSGIILEC